MNRSVHSVECTIKLIQARDNDGLNHLAIEGAIFDRPRIKLLDELKCKSITVFELKDHFIQFVRETNISYYRSLMDITRIIITMIQGLSLFKQLYENCMSINYLCNKLHLILKLHLET